MGSRVHARRSQASLASTLAVLAESASRHADHPGRLQEAVDRVAFRIRDVEDFFRFCPSQGDVPPGSGTIFGLASASPALVAGVLIRRLFTERMGDEFELTLGLAYSVFLALQEYRSNIALLEFVLRCRRVREEYAAWDDAFFHIMDSVQTLRALVQEAPAGRTRDDRACVGAASGVYGVRDSHAYYVEADLCHAVLGVLFSADFRGWPRAAVESGGEAETALRRAWLSVGELAGELRQYPSAMQKVMAFVSSAAPLVFRHDIDDVNSELWTWLHMLASSPCGAFIEDALLACAKSRMREPEDLRAMYVALHGDRWPEGRAVFDRVACAEVRLLFGHAILLMFRMMELLRHQAGQPPRFVARTVEDMRARFLSPLRHALDGAAASSWPPLRHALGALAAVAEKGPANAGEQQWLRGAREAFFEFSRTEFLLAEGGIAARDAEALLDPFGCASAAESAEPLAERLRERGARQALEDLEAADAAEARRAASEAAVVAAAEEAEAAAAAAAAAEATARLRTWKGRVTTRGAATARLPRCGASGRPDSCGGALTARPTSAARRTRTEPASKDSSAPMGLDASPRALGMRFFDLVKPPPPEYTRSQPDPWGMLPRPLPSNSSCPSPGRRALVRGALPPLGGTKQARGFFFDASTAQYVT